jgi:hypothetical protein
MKKFTFEVVVVQELIESEEVEIKETKYINLETI